MSSSLSDVDPFDDEDDFDPVEWRRGNLRARGVPEPFIEPIATREESVLTRSGWVARIAYGLPAVWLVSSALDWIGDYPLKTAEAAALRRDAILFGVLPVSEFAYVAPLAALMAGFAALWALACLLYFPRKPAPGPCLGAVELREYKAALSERLVRLAIHAAAQRARTADDLLRGFAWRELRTALLVTAGFLLLALATFPAVFSYWTSDHTGLMRHRFGVQQFYPWEKLTGVTVGCNYDRRAHFTYAVQFGETVVPLADRWTHDENFTGWSCDCSRSAATRLTVGPRGAFAAKASPIRSIPVAFITSANPRKIVSSS